jgi:hypothetical protein
MHDAAAEARFGHMIRINEDAAEGGWTKWSDWFRGQRRPGWSAYGNAFDGLVHWSRLAGRGRVILDPDFIRLNTFASADEKMSVVSLCLLAGGPVTVADQHDTIGGDLWVYLNPELLELNRDGFVGQPLSPDPLQEESQIWFGQLSGGDWIVGLFNRENEPRTRFFNFAALGLAGPAEVRDLWAHENLGAMDSFRARSPRAAAASCAWRRPAAPPSCRKPPPPWPSPRSTCSPRRRAWEPFTPKPACASPTPPAGPCPMPRYTPLSAPLLMKPSAAAPTPPVSPSCAPAPPPPDPVQLHAAVTHVHHPRLAYLGHRNTATAAGTLRHVAGTFNRWRPQAMHFAHGQWRAESVLIAAGDHRLKFADTRDFSGDDWGDAQGLSGRVTPTTGGRPDVRFRIPQTALYDIAFDPDTLQYALQPSSTQTLQKQMYVAGSFARWKIHPMQFDGAQWTLPAVSIPAGRHELKFLNTPDFSGDDWGQADGSAGTAAFTTGGGANLVFEVPTGGVHAIAFRDISGQYLIRPAP